jgi:Skp family chaperone for outer membrane proteins
VAVIDLPKVFKQHAGFNGQVEGLEHEAQAIESQINAKNQALAAKSKQLKELRIGSPEHRRLESELVRQASELRLLARQKQKEMRLREAQQYYQAYMEIRAAIARVARRHNIALVLRFDSKPIDPRNIQSVARGMNQPVVLQQNLDITQLVIEELPRAVIAKQPGGLPRR